VPMISGAAPEGNISLTHSDVSSDVQSWKWQGCDVLTAIVMPYAACPACLAELTAME